MAGRKRAADSDSAPTTRASKTAKTEGTAPKAKKGPKTKLSTTAFKTKAPPIYVNLTQTAPAEEGAPAEDLGFLGAVTLAASSFTTGTYGWKGSKRITVEVDNPEGTEKEKLQVQLTINATVMGSKSAKGEEAEGDAEKTDEDKAVTGEEQKAHEGDGE